MNAGIKCRVVIPQTPNACGKPADGLLVFPDRDKPDKVAACMDCALRLQQTAGAHGTNLKFERFAT